MQKIKVWKPKHGEEYFFISERYNKILKDTFNKWDTRHKERYYCGNCFQTHTDAYAMFDVYIRKMNDFYENHIGG